MRRLYFVILGCVALAFLGALLVLVLPILTRDDGAFLTAPSASAPAGELIQTSRPDLRPDLPQTAQYSPAPPDGAGQHPILDGVTPRTWWGYAPEGLRSPAPVILLFHGAGRDGASMIDMWQAVARASGLVLVAPDLPDASGPAPLPDGAFLNALIDAAEGAYPIDRSRVFLFGHSAGAITAQITANRIEGPWRGVAAHAGTVATAMLHPIEEAPPLRLYLGEADALFDLAGAEVAAQALAQAGHDVTLITIPGHTHWFYEGGPAIAADAWGWMSGL